MIVLLVIAVVAGLVTAVSPCILPVLPVIVAAGAEGALGEDGQPRPVNRWRPYAIVGGMVASFAVFTLAGSALLSALHLPQDLLEWLGAAVLLLLAVGLLVPPVGHLLERPFARFGGGRQSSSASGLVVGVSLGLLYTPCAGPILTAISVAGTRRHFGIDIVLITAAYVVGTAIPLLVLCVLSQRAAVSWPAVRRHAPTLRKVGGAVIGLMALALVFSWTAPLQTALPGTTGLEDRVATSAGVTPELLHLSGEHRDPFKPAPPSAASALPMLGRAPDFTGITAWLHTPGNRPLSLRALRGHVVLVDFWTYSCINCQRSLPHVEAWYRAYHADGFDVVGVSTPEFAFEHVVSNVKAAAARLGVVYPVAVDDNDATWDAYDNEYWPAEYLIDQNGELRHEAFGEGDYAATERAIRLLLAARPGVHLPPATEVANRTPTEQALTPESYLGYDRLNNYVGSPLRTDEATSYTPQQPVPPDQLTLGGTWTVHQQEMTAGSGATLALNFEAMDVYLVLSGTGTVTASVGGGAPHRIAVGGVPDLYTMVALPRPGQGVLTLHFTPGLQAYDFTFG